jgi:hypothetical protein
MLIVAPITSCVRVPWSQQIPLQVHDPTSRLGMGPTTLSLISPRWLGTLAPREIYVEHLTSDVYCPQPLTKPPP